MIAFNQRKGTLFQIELNQNFLDVQTGDLTVLALIVFRVSSKIF